MELEHIAPADIEKRSFEIITEELGDIAFVPGTEKIVKGDIWTPAAGWQQIETDGRYAAITKESAAYHGLERLRAIVKGYQYWLNRYRVDLPQTANAKKDQKASK